MTNRYIYPLPSIYIKLNNIYKQSFLMSYSYGCYFTFLYTKNISLINEKMFKPY